MAKIVISSAIETSSVPKPVTINVLADLYDAIHKFDKEKGHEKEFLAKFGKRKDWLGQFTPKGA